MKKTKKKVVGAKKTGTVKAPAKIKTVTVAGPKKQYIKKNTSCKVTFRLPKEAAPTADMVTIVGDFNNWDKEGTQMQKLKSGEFKATVELPCNKEYRFRYLIDADRWENDWAADKYIPNEFGDDDSVIVIENGNSTS